MARRRKNEDLYTNCLSDCDNNSDETTDNDKDSGSDVSVIVSDRSHCRIILTARVIITILVYGYNVIVFHKCMILKEIQEYKQQVNI